MIGTQKIAVVMPAYNAGKTLEKTYLEIPRDIVDEVILVDDKSKDNTVEEARRLGIEHIVQHDDNLGYGGNQKSCYSKALELDCDIVIMVHPDYQYTPSPWSAQVAPSIIANGTTCVFARIWAKVGDNALHNTATGIPGIANILLGQNL